MIGHCREHSYYDVSCENCRRVRRSYEEENSYYSSPIAIQDDIIYATQDTSTWDTVTQQDTTTQQDTSSSTSDFSFSGGDSGGGGSSGDF